MNMTLNRVEQKIYRGGTISFIHHKGETPCPFYLKFMRSLKNAAKGSGVNLSLLLCFGKKVKHIRKIRHLSQEVLSQDAHLDRSYISHIECGKCNPSLLIINQIAGALDVTMNELVSDIDN
ncbi:helix-turn-helix transcriptional regulator [Pantoea sp. MBD-2R]|uniref:helix-turn-helix domain-containing protein n=1 Tax=Pantoea sp. MBD-2R TaxID=3141540 RepID=UPI003183EA01